jgi:hypothetical protein
MFADNPSGRHWLYLPLAAILSTALRCDRHPGRRAVGIWNPRAGLAVAAALAVTGLSIHRRAGNRRRTVNPQTDAS